MTPVTNHSVDDKVYTDGELTYTEIIAQEYAFNDCKFSAGYVDGDPVDKLYLRLEKPGVEATLLRIRPDEAAALAWCLSGLLYHLHLQEVADYDPA